MSPNPYEGVKSQEAESTFRPGYQGQADPELIKHLLDPNPVLMELQMAWLGLTTNEKGDVIQIGKPLMNMRGVFQILNLIRPVYNHFACMSNLSEDEIYGMIEELQHNISELLFMKDDDFELDNDYKDSIIDNSRRMALTGLNRAKNQGEKVFLSKTHESRAIYQEKDKQKKGVRSIFPW